MRFQITTDAVPERERFDLWNDSLYRMLAIKAEPLADALGPFRAQFSARTSGPLLNCTFDVDRCRASRQGREIAHQHWDSFWIMRESSVGGMHTIDGREVISRPGDLLIGDTDTTSDTRPLTRYTHELWVLPKALLAPHLPALGRPLLARLSGRSGIDALAATYLDGLTRNWDNISEADMGQVADTLCRLIGVACGSVAGEQLDAVRAGRLVEAKRYIERHLADPALSPASVAAALGMSVRTLHLLFEPTGVSFARHVLRRRLEECQTELLANPARAVTDIAFAWGFNNLSSFYRAFQDAFGMAPGAVRAAARERRVA